MNSTISIQEFKDELPPKYETWRDFYFDTKRWCGEQEKDFSVDQEVMCDHMPLAHLHDLSARHIYRTTVSFIKAKVFEEIESELTQLNPESLTQWYYEALRNNKFLFTNNNPYVLMRWMIDFAYQNQHIHQPKSNKD